MYLLFYLVLLISASEIKNFFAESVETVDNQFNNNSSNNHLNNKTSNADDGIKQPFDKGVQPSVSPDQYFTTDDEQLVTSEPDGGSDRTDSNSSSGGLVTEPSELEFTSSDLGLATTVVTTTFTSTIISDATLSVTTRKEVDNNKIQ